LNFNALLGWSPYAKATGDKPGEFGSSNSEIFTIDEAVKNFDYHNIGTSPAIFNTDKLDYLNGIYIRKKTLPELLVLCKNYLTENIALTSNNFKKTDEFLLKVINLERERLTVLSEIAPHTKFFFVDDLQYDSAMLVWKKSDAAGAKSCLQNLYRFLENVSEANWNSKKLEELIVADIKAKGSGLGDYLWPMRVALTGEKASPPPFEMADALGKTETLGKIKKAISLLSS
jgi:glutamyl/glutaminyl-tRNA synthetase